MEKCILSWMEIYLKSFWNLTGAKFHKKYFCDKILFLTVSKNKIAATPENIGVVAILTVVLNYSILFPSFTFFLDGFHLAFGDKFEICIKTTDLM